MAKLRADCCCCCWSIVAVDYRPVPPHCALRRWWRTGRRCGSDWIRAGWDDWRCNWRGHCAGSGSPAPSGGSWDWAATGPTWTPRIWRWPTAGGWATAIRFFRAVWRLWAARRPTRGDWSTAISSAATVCAWNRRWWCVWPAPEWRPAATVAPVATAATGARLYAVPLRPNRWRSKWTTRLVSTKKATEWATLASTSSTKCAPNWKRTIRWLVPAFCCCGCCCCDCCWIRGIRLLRDWIFRRCLWCGPCAPLRAATGCSWVWRAWPWSTGIGSAGNCSAASCAGIPSSAVRRPAVGPTSAAEAIATGSPEWATHCPRCSILFRQKSQKLWRSTSVSIGQLIERLWAQHFRNEWTNQRGRRGNFEFQTKTQQIESQEV